MFVSFGAMVVDPERAVAWSFHMLGSLFTVIFLAPLIVFLQPSSEPEDAVEANRPAEPAPEESDDSVSFIPSFFSGSDASEPAATEAAATSESYDESELRSIWSYAEEDAARERSAAGDGAANRTPERPSEPASSSPASNGSPSNDSPPNDPASHASSNGSSSDASVGGWPWADETEPASASTSESAGSSHSSSAGSTRASESADTQWADSMWPPEEDGTESAGDTASGSTSSSDDDTWPPANWPSLDDYDY
jgi:hypothetical protein